MIPIGILTRNRPVYLDATLRSLSATELPGDVSVTVYDDASDDPAARRYLDTDDTFAVDYSWPRCEQWQEAGLDFLSDHPTLYGIADRVEMLTIGPKPLGVGNASCFAVRDLFARQPDTPGVILLQDDVVFNENWYRRMIGCLSSIVHRGKRLGIVTGMHLDHRQTRRINRTSPVRFCSAQCYLITRSLFDDQRDWFERTDHEPKNFDKWLCKLLRANEYELQLIYPYVCQHIGTASQVRPEVAFFRDERASGRIGLGASGPYAFADEVCCFLNRTLEAAAC